MRQFAVQSRVQFYLTEKSAKNNDLGNYFVDIILRMRIPPNRHKIDSAKAAQMAGQASETDQP